MATAKSMKIQAEIDKVKAKISEQQARLKELEQKKLEAENSEIVDIVRGMSIPLAELPLLFEKLKGGGALGQSVPKSEDEEKEEKLNMKRFRVLTSGALCRCFLLCGFSVPAYAYAGGEGEDYGDPTMETPAPEPTITPGEGFSEEGNLVTRDLLYDEHTNKQFITVQTSGGNTFYIVIDYDKPVDEEGEQYETYFFSVVDQGDLLAAAEAAGVNRRSAPVRRNVRRDLECRLPGMLCQYGEMRRRRAGARACPGA